MPRPPRPRCRDGAQGSLRDRLPVISHLRRSVGLQRTMLVLGLVITSVFLLTAVFAPLLAPYGFAQQEADGVKFGTSRRRAR